MTGPSIVWFRQDLRLDDNPALRAAVERGGAVVPVFLWSPEEEDRWAPASASRWWLHQSLRVLNAELKNRGSGLVLRHGPAETALRDLIRETGAEAVFWNRRYEPALIRRDTALKNTLKKENIHAESFNGGLLVEPWEVETKQARPFQVFTAFWKTAAPLCDGCQPQPAPAKLPATRPWPASVDLDSFGLEPKIDWAAGIREAWEPGCIGARKRLDDFIERGAAHYDAGRDRPDHDGTSRLSPHLHFGEISPRRVWQAVMGRAGSLAKLARGREVYLKELGWREFAHHLLYHFPHTADAPLREQFADFPWEYDRKGLKAWQRGQTGYPIVDAGMRQLWHTGWMHNRVRMIVASFLTKDLRIAWQTGAKWFWDTLVDADLANNTLGWQWTAGCGADAAPYFRIFNPVTQGEKFDPDGRYVRRWVPELSGLPAKWIHAPWTAPAGVLGTAGIELGMDYPEPIVDHAEARRLALEAFAQVKRG